MKLVLDPETEANKAKWVGILSRVTAAADLMATTVCRYVRKSFGVPSV